MILKGQNFRIMQLVGTKWQCIGMATNCTVNLTNNTEDASHKDIVGMAALPTTTSQSWSVQVDSLNVADTGAMLTAMKNLTPFTLLWDETSTSDNQTGEGAAYCRKGQAFLNDCVFQFDDRTNSTKQLQFSGSGALETVSTPTYEAVAASAFTKGQFVRLFLSSDNTTAPAKVIAAAKTLSLHVSMTLEDATTKDTTGNWQIQEPTGLNYDISTSALVRGGDTITSAVLGQDLSSIESIYEDGTPVKWKIANVSGANQRTASSTICSGSCLLTSLQISSQNRSNATYQATLTGYGPYTVGA
jgi:predicted secreted protein